MTSCRCGCCCLRPRRSWSDERSVLVSLLLLVVITTLGSAVASDDVDADDDGRGVVDQGWTDNEIDDSQESAADRERRRQLFERQLESQHQQQADAELREGQ